MTGRKLTVVVPVRDEALALGAVLDGIREAIPAAEVVVVDDGSRDASPDIAADAGARVVRSSPGRGYGAAVQAGVAAARTRYVALVDGDGSYDPGDLRDLAARVESGGLVVGARPPDPSPARRLGKGLALGLCRLLTGRCVPDLNSGLRVFDRRLLERLAPVLPDRFSLTTTLTLGALALGAPVRFVDVGYRARLGRSKFRPADAARMLRTVWRGAGRVRAGAVAPPSGLSSRGRVALLGLLALAAFVGPRISPGLLLAVVLGWLAWPAFVLPKVLRWRGLLRATGVELPLREAAEAYVAGMAAGAVTPGRVGELVRLAGPAAKGRPLAALALTTAVDRLLDLAVLGLVGAAALTLSAAPAAWAAAGVGALALAGGWLLLPSASLVARRWSGRPLPSVPPRALLRAVGWSVLSIGLFFAVATALLGAAGVEAPLAVLLTAVAAGNLAALLPASVGGVGTREAAVLGVLLAGGSAAGASEVAAFGLAFHAVFTGAPWLALLSFVGRAPAPARAPAR